MNNKRAKISDICLTGRQGRHPVLTDVKNVHVVRIQKNRTEKLIETRESEPTMKLILSNVKSTCNWYDNKSVGQRVHMFYNAISKEMAVVTSGDSL